MKKALVALSLLMILTLLLTACGEKTSTTTTSTTVTTVKPMETTTTTPVDPNAVKRGGTLRFIYPYSPTSIPGFPNDDNNAQRMWMEWICFEPLVKPDKMAKPIPWLAESWEQSADKLECTFHLRKGVKFHDGTDFTAEAVKMEADLLIETKKAGAMTWDRWEIIDDYTIKVYLKYYQNDFFGNLMGVNMCFISPTAWKANGEEYMKEHPIGTGPFVFDYYEKDVTMKFKAFDDYWQEGKPYLDGIDMITVKENLTAQASMQAGEGDVWALQQGKTLYDMKNAGFVVNYDYGGSDFLLFDTMNEGSVTNDVRVRMAIEYALNKQAMADALGYGYLIPNNQWSGPYNPTFNKNLPSRDYDPEKAKQLLAEAGYPDGGPTLHIITIGSEPEILSVQQYLEAVGFVVELEAVDNAKFWNYCMTGWTGLLNVGYAVGNNFASALIGYFPPASVIDVSVKVPDEIMAKAHEALLILDDAEAKVANDEIIKELYDICWMVPFYSNAMGTILTTKVKDSGLFEFADWSQWSPENCWLEK